VATTASDGSKGPTAAVDEEQANETVEAAGTEVTGLPQAHINDMSIARTATRPRLHLDDGRRR
jgi:hypothetical protein